MNAEMCLIPLTLCSGTIGGAEQWEIYKALRKAMKTGKAQEVYAAGAAIMRDMRDPKKAKAYNEGMRRAEISARMGQILRNDHGEIGKLVGEAIKAKKELNRMREKMEGFQAALEKEKQMLRRAAKDVTEGVNEEATKQFRRSREEIAKLNDKMKEQESQIKEKKEEMNAAYGKAVSMAEGKAKREMMEEAERRTRRKQRDEAGKMRFVQDSEQLRLQENAEEEEQTAETANMKSDGANRRSQRSTV